MSAHPPLTPFGSALAGALGAVFANATVYPLDTVKTRLQALPASSRPRSETGTRNLNIKDVREHPQSLPKKLLRRLRRWQMLSLLLQILKTEGLTGAFKGFSASMINTFSTQFAYFFFHTLLRTATIRRLSLRSPSKPIVPLSTTSELLLGALAGALAQIFTIPVAVIATRQQLYLPPTSTPDKPAPSLIDMAREIIAESGITGLWTGLKPGLVLTINPAITYGVFERLKGVTLMETGKAKLSAGEAFLLGVGSKTLATVVTYPYIFAKVRLQAKSTDSEEIKSVESVDPTNDGSPSFAEIASHPPDPSAPVLPNSENEKPGAPRGSPGSRSTPIKHQQRGAIPLLAAVYRERGFFGWYQGLTAQVLKAVLCQGILFASKDQFEVYALVIIALLARVRSRIALK